MWEFISDNVLCVTTRMSTAAAVSKAIITSFFATRSARRRERVRGELEGRSYVVRVMESDSNFLLFQMTGSAKEVRSCVPEERMTDAFRAEQ